MRRPPGRAEMANCGGIPPLRGPGGGWRWRFSDARVAIILRVEREGRLRTDSPVSLKAEEAKGTVTS